MELSTQIKKYRINMNLSQEELAEKVYVTRQTISNWENSKNYPDIHSLLLLSSLFNISLDQLIKGDIDIMKEEIKEADLQKFNYYSKIYTTLFVLSIVSFVPLAVFLKIYGLIISALLFIITIMVALKVEKFKKENNIQTYKEIVAFTEGKRLDEIETYRENGKRPYQKFLLMIGSGQSSLTLATILFYRSKKKGLSHNSDFTPHKIPYAVPSVAKSQHMVSYVVQNRIMRQSLFYIIYK